MDKRTDLVTMGGNPVTLLGNEVKPGDRAPDFTVLTGDLQPYSLKDAGSKIKIISVVPSLIPVYVRCKPCVSTMRP